MSDKKIIHQQEELAYLRNHNAEVRPEHELYQSYDISTDQARTNRHYEQHPDFFYRFTGGEWNCYSCNLWHDGTTTDTQSQEAKLDRMAQLMELKPGQRIMDVGCGWAGPLVYLCKTYGVRGVGLTLSPIQKAAAEARIAQYGVDVQIHLVHWKEFSDPEPFDAIYTDEVIVHFHDLDDYFKKVHSLLCPGGIMLNKEGHFTRKDYLTRLDRGEVFVNKIYGFTGNYRTLYEELAFMDEAGFELVCHEQIDRAHYRKTFDRWLSNMYENRARMIEVADAETYQRFRAYVKLVRAGFNTSIPTVDFVAGRKI